MKELNQEQLLSVSGAGLSLPEQFLLVLHLILLR